MFERARPASVVGAHSFRSGAELPVRPILRSFHDAYPDVVLDITLYDAVVDFVATGYDATIRIGELIEQDMIALRLGRELRQIAAAGPDYLAQYGTPESPHDLPAHRRICWRWPGHPRPYRWEFQEDGKWFDVGVEGPIVSSSRAFALQAAIDGIGIALAIEEVVGRHIAVSGLVCRRAMTAASTGCQSIVTTEWVPGPIHDSALTRSPRLYMCYLIMDTYSMLLDSMLLNGVLLDGVLLDVYLWTVGIGRITKAHQWRY
jgi:DNA-binding transcriptional LysR family regulator